MAVEIVYTGGLSVAVGDLDADGRPEIVVGTLAPPARIRVFDLNGTPRDSLIAPFPPDGRGVQVGVADLGGTGRGTIVAGESSGPDPLLETVDPTTGCDSSLHPACARRAERAQTRLRRPRSGRSRRDPRCDRLGWRRRGTSSRACAPAQVVPQRIQLPRLGNECRHGASGRPAAAVKPRRASDGGAREGRSRRRSLPRRRRQRPRLGDSTRRSTGATTRTGAAQS